MCRDIYICVGLFMCCYIGECITIKHFIIVRAGRKRRRIKGILSKSVLLAVFATIQSVKNLEANSGLTLVLNLNLLVVILYSCPIFK